MIYNADNVLHERNTGEVKLAVALERFKKWFKGEEMDTKKIDKMIHEIEKCNRKIDRYRNSDDKEKDKIRDNLKHNKELVAKTIREMFWLLPAAAAVGAASAFNVVLGLIVGGMFVGLTNERLSIDNFYNKLEAENNKALEWLKEERDTIKFKQSRKEKTDSKNESTIFESIDFI